MPSRPPSATAPSPSARTGTLDAPRGARSAASSAHAASPVLTRLQPADVDRDRRVGEAGRRAHRQRHSSRARAPARPRDRAPARPPQPASAATRSATAAHRVPNRIRLTGRRFPVAAASMPRVKLVASLAQKVEFAGLRVGARRGR